MNLEDNEQQNQWDFMQQNNDQAALGIFKLTILVLVVSVVICPENDVDIACIKSCIFVQCFWCFHHVLCLNKTLCCILCGV